ncbi:MAG: tRNA (adenosine(37)-N6)-threonylcarbamoyltransferase complex dimerization subunit type 1 TsaB [Acidimicrobiia bacterium]|nr:tRNA (adenosine(37)-N6)-threonylcarbamoyltransferase complex dimerization subunit type 1 TsaB [Acidimicrobiia bacterium]MBT8247264.1 tRNA (adenosine(37)-N6)-threonylcarbamoyltransferase complex dimerization subunit type 1 TsaB [Acidimicrobiia bacterium]NNF87202.1 tRNA (adenosine(37)-N6)-threonylcarbamoyltransferase complex dimerization subunit type 1 TsaB [Acidimicrobiia bacterium]NNJ48063.1 tRNA (adenosine(37)-N6)-threonylcarbamoyltransferase complex dimerization subunit type 1 TsaB [Acidimi
MNILAIETATPASSVALGTDSELLAMSLQVDRRGHVGFLVNAMDYCFQQVGWTPAELDAVVVDVGPGLFTGIRAGLATAQGVAAATGAQLLGLTSLDVLAFRASTGRRIIWPVVDVRRNEVATAPYRPVPGGVIRDGPPEVVGPEGLAALLDSTADDTLVVGDHEALPAATLRGLHRAKLGRPRWPSADVLLELARARMAKGDLPAPDDVRPLYLRDPDVTINWKDFREEAGWSE